MQRGLGRRPPRIVASSEHGRALYRVEIALRTTPIRRSGRTSWATAARAYSHSIVAGGLDEMS